MRFDLRREWPAVLLIASMFAASALLWPSAPESMPIHWGFSGEPDDYGPKAVGLFGVPFVAVLVYLSMLSGPYVDAGRINRGRFPVSFPVLRAAIVALLAAIHAFALLWIVGG